MVCLGVFHVRGKVCDGVTRRGVCCSSLSCCITALLVCEACLASLPASWPAADVRGSVTLMLVSPPRLTPPPKTGVQLLTHLLPCRLCLHIISFPSIPSSNSTLLPSLPAALPSSSAFTRIFPFYYHSTPFHPCFYSLQFPSSFQSTPLLFFSAFTPPRSPSIHFIHTSSASSPIFLSLLSIHLSLPSLPPFQWLAMHFSLFSLFPLTRLYSFPPSTSFSSTKPCLSTLPSVQFLCSTAPLIHPSILPQISLNLNLLCSSPRSCRYPPPFTRSSCLPLILLILL